ncbi:DUF2726 domain-containing protein [Vibrio maerlii]|uniref:DUF2726 domain-containing protein n=1 Tax=Vibrio maerlii TaxID=2231648 RepID=UPI000E3DAC9B|nr:DUF2726 domain-containing protein [Vibrio maerlii]
MTNIFIVVIALVAFFLIIQKYIIGSSKNDEYVYRSKKSVQTSSETAFFNALKTALGDKGVALAKPNMTTVLTPAPTKTKKKWAAAVNKIARYHFDFVVCDPRTMEVRCVIAFDDGQPLDKSKVEREKLLIKLCKQANIPLIGASVKHSYQVGRLKRLLATHIDLIEPDKEVRFCKKCGSPMVIKLANQGEFKGRRFFTCSRQPMCTYTENYNVVFDEEA